MTSAGSAPDCTVSTNGYRFTTTSSNAAMLRSLNWSSCASRRKSARMPACTDGCRVFTRPSRDSGNPVTVETSVTSWPARRMVAAVDPVETISTPAAASASASSTRPALSLTEMRARFTGMMSRSRYRRCAVV